MTDERKTKRELLAEIGGLRQQLAEARHQLDQCAGAAEPLRADEFTYRDLVESANSIVLRWDTEGRVRYLNAYGLEFFGYRQEEILGRSVIGTIVPETEGTGRDLVAMIHDILVHTDRYLSNENENMRRSGERVWITWRNRPIVDEQGGLREILSIGIDRTARKRVEEALRESELRHRVLFRSTPVAIIERDASELKTHLERLRQHGIADPIEHVAHSPEELARCSAMIRTTDVNQAALDLLEASSPEDLRSLAALHGPETFLRVARGVFAAGEDGQLVSREREETIATYKGNIRNVLVRTTVVPGCEETLSRILLTVVDITERKEAEAVLRANEERFRYLSEHDNLTGLFNTRYLYKRLRELIDTCPGGGTCMSLIFLDIDRFKHVVDTYGHLNGSRAIQEVAAIVRGAIDEPAFAVAYAGDEFVVVLPGFDRRRAVDKAEEIRRQIAEGVFLARQGHSVRLSVSLGISCYPDDAADLENLLARADHALFSVKAAGRDAVADGVTRMLETEVKPSEAKRSAGTDLPLPRH